MSMGMQIVRQRALSAIIFTVLLTGGVLSSCVATAATYYVATTGSDANPGSQSQPFRTIDKGVSVLRAGDTLYLRRGTYNPGRFGQHASVPLPSGTSWSNAVTIAGHPGETVTLSGFRAGLSLTDPVSYLIFDNLIIDASAGAGGIFINCDTHHIRFQNGEVKNSVNAPKDKGSLIAGCGSLEVLNSKIHHAYHYGFYWGGHDSIFDGNEVYANNGYAYHIYSSGQNNVSNNIVRNNIIHGNGFVNVPNANLNGGLIISAGSNNQAYNNVMYNNFAGIQVDYRCTNCQVYNNTIYGNTTGGAAGIYLGSTVVNSIVKNNIVYANGQPGITNDGDAGAVIDHNWTDSNGDPKFVNATANDFRLQSTSPAIDAGVTLSVVPTDLNKIARPQGSRHDIGAYEYSTFR